MSEYSDSVVSKLDELKERYDRVKERLEQAEHAEEFIQKWGEMDASYATWRADPEHLGNGIDWARATARAIEQVKNFLPAIEPDFVREFITGELGAIPTYVDALTSLLRQHIEDIDHAYEVVSGDVSLYSGDNAPTCSGGLIDAAGARAIRQLNVDESMKVDIFRAACSAGLKGALARFDLAV